VAPDAGFGLRPEDFASFRELGVEVCIRTAHMGDVWLVPARTGLDRQELTPEQAATLCRVVDAFPGSEVVAFQRAASPAQEGLA
jgi:hypothetical protein